MNESRIPHPNSIYTVSTETINRLKENQSFLNWHPSQIINQAREAMMQLSGRENGLVLGSGKNTGSWKKRGWKTLDIDSSYHPDVVLDANQLETKFGIQSQDFIFAENIIFDRTARQGVSPSRLLNQANKILKLNGILIIQTGYIINREDCELPIRDEYSDLMVKHGFEVIVEVGYFTHWPDGESAQDVVYFGKKIANGFNPNININKQSSSFHPQTGKPIF